MKRKISSGTLLVVVLVALAALLAWWALRARVAAPTGQLPAEEASAGSAAAPDSSESFGK
jgi:hypothetical protein